MGRIRRGEARDKDYDRLNKVGSKKHADDAEPTVRARRFFFFDPRHRLTSSVHTQEIWPTNAKVNAVNRQGLERLKDPPKRFESGDWVRPFKNIPPYISVDEVTHALKTCDFIKSAPASSNAHCCLSPRTPREVSNLTQVQQIGGACC